MPTQKPLFYHTYERAYAHPETPRFPPVRPQRALLLTVNHGQPLNIELGVQRTQNKL